MKARSVSTPLDGAMDAARVAPRRPGRRASDPERALVIEAHHIIQRNIKALPSDARRDWLALVESASRDALGGEVEQTRQRREDAQRRAATRRQRKGEPAFHEQLQQAAQAHPSVANRARRLGAIKAILKELPDAKTKDVAKALRAQYLQIPQAAIDTLRKDIKVIKSGMRDTPQ